MVKDNELGALVEALDGQYVEPGPGGDPIRNPNVLPTGKNIHALDPQSIPTQVRIESNFLRGLVTARCSASCLPGHLPVCLALPKHVDMGCLLTLSCIIVPHAFPGLLSSVPRPP